MRPFYRALDNSAGQGLGHWGVSTAAESVRIEPLHLHPENTMNVKKLPTVELDGKDLPAHCPNPAMPLWSSHPRVFLDFDHHGDAKCPYCGTEYRLKPGTVVAHH
jgi:uncharacterized Zn-finger protein